MWNFFPIYTGERLKLSDFCQPWASDEFEICHKGVEQDAKVYSNGEGRDSSLMHGPKYAFYHVVLCGLKNLIGVF